MPKFYLALYLCFLFCSCSVGPDFKTPKVYSDENIKKSLNLKNVSSDPGVNWYTMFNDETLNLLINRGIAENKDIKSTISKLKQSRDALKINSVQYLPFIDISGKYDFAKFGKDAANSFEYNYFQTGFDASWELDIWGEGRRLKEEYLNLYKVAKANVDNVRLSVVAEIASDYFKLRTTEKLLEAANKNLTLQEELFSTVKSKYQNGLVGNLDYTQAQYLLEQTRSSIPELKTRIKAYKNALNVLIGSLPDDNIAYSKTKSLTSQKFDFDIKKLYNYPVSIIRTRPDVMIAEYNLAAKNAAIGQAVAQLYPDVNISALVGYQSVSGKNLFKSDTSAYNYTPAVRLPIFHWNSLLNNVELKKHIKEEYLAIYEQTLLNAVSDISVIITKIENEYRTNQALSISYAKIKEARNITKEQYNNGLIDFSEVLRTEQNLIEAENKLIQSNGNIYTYIIAFYKSLGR